MLCSQQQTSAPAVQAVWSNKKKNWDLMRKPVFWEADLLDIKSTLLNIHKWSPVDVVVVVAGAAVAVEVRPGVLRGRRSVVRLQAVEVDERFVVSQPRAREE